jgi:Flp pilus assembly protein TadG
MMQKITPITNQRGAVAIEMAIVTPLLVVLLFGIIEFSLAFYNKSMITNASRVGARAAIAGLTDANQRIIDYCNNKLFDLSNTDDVVDASDITITNVTLVGDTKNAVSVSIDYTYNFLFGSLLGLDNANLNMSANTTMRME